MENSNYNNAKYLCEFLQYLKFLFTGAAADCTGDVILKLKIIKTNASH